MAIIESVLQKLEHTFDEVKGTYEWYKTCEEYTPDCEFEIVFLKNEIDYLLLLSEDIFGKHRLSKVEQMLDYFRIEVLQSEHRRDK